MGMMSLCFILLRAAAPLVLFSLYIVSGLVRFDWGEWLLLRTDDPTEENVVH
jgi:hypothetical protein